MHFSKIKLKKTHFLKKNFKKQKKVFFKNKIKKTKNFQK